MPSIQKLRDIPELPNSGLFHNYHDDSRHVSDDKGNVIGFDSSLNVKKNIVQVGWIKSNKTFYFESINGEKFDTNIPVNDWHWKNLEDAEIKIALHLLDIK